MKPKKKLNTFAIDALIIINSKNHTSERFSIETYETTPDGKYNKKRAELVEKYKKDFPDAHIAIHFNQISG